jgi:hypothetical protein
MNAKHKSLGSVVSIATGLGDRGVGFESSWDREFYLIHVVQAASGAHPAS